MFTLRMAPHFFMSIIAMNESRVQARRLVKFAARGGLVLADLAAANFRFVVVLALHGRAGDTPQHGELADVREGIGDGALEKFFGCFVQRLAAGQKIVKRL